MLCLSVFVFVFLCVRVFPLSHNPQTEEKQQRSEGTVNRRQRMKPQTAVICTVCTAVSPRLPQLLLEMRS